MGGLAGVIHFDPPSPPREWADDLAAAVACRGPDDEGSFQGGPALLVHRRNAVLAGGRRQPIVGDRLVLAFDGRLYDHLDLARQFGQPLGAAGEVAGDAEVLLRAWQQWGPACLHRLDGAYAFAIWDRCERELYLVRGSMGLRPLYYTTQGRRFAFSSLPTALLTLPWVSRELSSRGLCEYLSFRYVHAPRTLLRDVHALPPGCMLRVNRHGSRLTRYLTFPFQGASSAQQPDSAEATRELGRRIREAVLRRSHVDVPVAVLLSGGLDSSWIALQATSVGRTVRTYHLVFEGSGVDEAAFAGRVATLLGTDHTPLRVGARDFESVLDRCAAAFGVPLPDPAAVLQHLLYRAVRERQRVVLTGDGGDELFAGGHVALAAEAARRWQRLGGPRRLLSRLPVPGRRRHPSNWGGRGPLLGGTEVFSHRERASLLDPHRDPCPGLRLEALLPYYRDPIADPVNQVLSVYQQTWLPEDSLARSDRMGAACGVEVRYPLLDRRVVSFANARPGAWKLGHRFGSPVPKRPMRALLRDFLPPSLLDRPKRSFPRPLNHWLRTEGSGFLHRRAERLLDGDRGIWQPDPVRERVRAHLAGERDLGESLWLLIFLEAWLSHLDEIRPVSWGSAG